MSKAFCMASYTMNETVQTTMNGYLLMEGMPCEDGEPCANCLTFALETGNGLYYLVTENEQIKNTLNAFMMNELPRQATITGVPFKQGSFDYIQVYDITIGAYRLRHLCDEWNVMEVSNVTCGYCEEYHTVNYLLTTDTMINQQLYVKMEGDHVYKGALREDVYGDIIYIPAGSTREYLLYSFGAQEGQTLTNLWLGGNPKDAPEGWTMTVEEIRNTNPRTFVLSTGFAHTDGNLENDPLYLEWIEGIGFTEGPIGAKRCVGCADSRAYILLCAYKNGEQVYKSEAAKEFNCYFDSNPAANDTIPMYFIKDGPGSSTVEPVDPNQIIATLKKDWLSIFVSLDKEITYSLTRAIIPNKMPARNNTNSSNTFRESVSVQLTEPGTYTLQLTNPEWDYVIVGTFDYVSGYMSVEQTDSPAPSVQKILRNGQLLFLRDGGIYTITGLKIQ